MRGATCPLSFYQGDNSVKYWTGELASELAARLERDTCAHGRVAHLLTTSIHAPADIDDRKNGSVSHSEPLTKQDAGSLAQVRIDHQGSLFKLGFRV